MSNCLKNHVSEVSTAIEHILSVYNVDLQTRNEIVKFMRKKQKFTVEHFLNEMEYEVLSSTMMYRNLTF